MWLLHDEVHRNSTPAVPVFPPRRQEHAWVHSMTCCHLYNYGGSVPMFLRYHLSSLSILYGEKTGAACPYAHIHAYRVFLALGNSVRNNLKGCAVRSAI
jgi:hypothetical protein